MFNRKPKTYNILLKEEASASGQSALPQMHLVAEGFNLWAFLLTPIWALYHSLWKLLILAVIVTFIVIRLQAEGVINPVQGQVISVGFQLWVALSAADFRVKKLRSKGFELVGVVIAANELLAQQRALDSGMVTLQSKKLEIDTRENQLTGPTGQGAFDPESELVWRGRQTAEV